jgi:hypothetical protein
MSALCSCAPCWILALAGLNSGTGVDLGIFRGAADVSPHPRPHAQRSKCETCVPLASNRVYLSQNGVRTSSLDRLLEPPAFHVKGHRLEFRPSNSRYRRYRAGRQRRDFRQRAKLGRLSAKRPELLEPS